MAGEPSGYTTTIMKTASKSALLLACALLLSGSFALRADDKPAKKDAKLIPYPLKTCAVTGEALDDKPYVFSYKGREIKLCCDSCKEDFEKNPSKFVKRLEEAEKKPAK